MTVRKTKSRTAGARATAHAGIAGVVALALAANVGSPTARADTFVIDHDLVWGPGNVRDFHVRVAGTTLQGITVERQTAGPPPPGGVWAPVTFTRQSGPTANEWGGGGIGGAAVNAPIGGTGKVRLTVTRGQTCDTVIEIWETFDGNPAMPRNPDGSLCQETKKYKYVSGNVRPACLVDLDADGWDIGEGGEITYLVDGIYDNMVGSCYGSMIDSDGDGLPDWADPETAGGTLLPPSDLTIPYGTPFTVPAGISVPLMTASRVVNPGCYMLVTGTADFQDGTGPHEFAYATDVVPEPATLALLLLGVLTSARRRLRLRRS